uniref:Uncharacterized protein n=1 Tax=Anguilla anguilla TaxID=7936 RepID=A0A0E9SV26_ANGAN
MGNMTQTQEHHHRALQGDTVLKLIPCLVGTNHFFDLQSQNI